MQKVPSHKLLRLAYQMASRLALAAQGTPAAAFQNLLQRTLARMAVKHPHHALLPLLTLRAGAGDDARNSGGATGQGKSDAAKSVLEVRIYSGTCCICSGLWQSSVPPWHVASSFAWACTRSQRRNLDCCFRAVPLPPVSVSMGATSGGHTLHGFRLLAQSVAHTSSTVKGVIQDMSAAIGAYTAIAVASVPDTKRHCTTVPMIAPDATRALKAAKRAPVLTLPVDVRPDGDYSGLPHVVAVLPAVTFVGGVSAPKRLEVEDNYRQVRALCTTQMHRLVAHCGCDACAHGVGEPAAAATPPQE
jgi:hypothetical protein